MKKIFLSFLMIIPMAFQNNAQTVTDIDGNVYDTIKIGSQVWFGENLKTSRFNDGTAIPLITDSLLWSSLSTPGYCYYNNDSLNYKNTYGALYNWYAVSTNKLCPTGWHVPSDSEWYSMILFLDANAQLQFGDESSSGYKMKESGSTHWNCLNYGSDNSSGFTALPGGSRNNMGEYNNIGDFGAWWTTDQFDANKAIIRYLICDDPSETREKFLINIGINIRCIKGAASGIEGVVNKFVFIVSPNPAHDQITITTSNYSDEADMLLQLFNIHGQLLLQKNLSEKRTQIDISNLSTGVYILKVCDEKNTWVEKVVKQ
jgi:uncharacterized protein (TIGR02145 family)